MDPACECARGPTRRSPSRSAARDRCPRGAPGTRGPRARSASRPRRGRAGATASRASAWLYQGRGGSLRRALEDLLAQPRRHGVACRRRASRASPGPRPAPASCRAARRARRRSSPLRRGAGRADPRAPSGVSGASQRVLAEPTLPSALRLPGAFVVLDEREGVRHGRLLAKQPNVDLLGERELAGARERRRALVVGERALHRAEHAPTDRERERPPRRWPARAGADARSA